MKSSAKKTRGRPSADTEAVHIRFPSVLIKRIDAWRKESGIGRPEAVRRLVEQALKK